MNVQKPEPDFHYERSLQADGYSVVAGIDEVGRGPWAGPVVASAVIFNPGDIPKGIRDSKKLSLKRREVLFDQILESASVGVGIAGVEEIDKLNILKANDLAMARAVDNLPVIPQYLLVDGNHVPPEFTLPTKAIVKGDMISLSIAAASIIAKVTRDRMMIDLAKTYPEYSWHTNMGYGTKAHIVALEQHGITPHHRRSFKPIHKILCASI